MRTQHPILIEQGQPPRDFQDALNDKHHVWTTSVILVETERDIVLQRPGKNAISKLGDLFAFAEHDGVFPDEIDSRHMTVQVDADTGQFERAATCSMWVDFPVP